MFCIRNVEGGEEMFSFSFFKERRKLLEAERQARLNEMQEKRKMRDHKVEQLFLVKEKERQELANQKAR